VLTRPWCGFSWVFLKKKIKTKTYLQDGTEAFWARVDDIARARLDAEDKLHLKAADTLHRELLQELDRCVSPHTFFPIFPPFSFFNSSYFSFSFSLSWFFFGSFPLVERAVADVPALADPEFAAGIRGHAENLLRRSRGIDPSGTFASLPPLFFLLLWTSWVDGDAPLRLFFKQGPRRMFH
jgi:hypothetical protein